MIATFFNKTKPNITFSLFILLAFSGVLSLFLTYSEDLWELSKKTVKFYLISASLLYFLIFSVKNHRLTLNNSYAGLFFVFILSSFPKLLEYNYQLVSIIPLYFSFFKIYGLYHHVKTQKNIFDSAFWIGVATLLSFWSFLFVILLYASMFINKKNNLRNFLSGVVGFIIPLFLFLTYHFYFDNLQKIYGLLNADILFSFSKYLQYPEIISVVFILFLTLMSFFIITPKTPTISKKFSSIWGLLIIHTIITFAFVGISMCDIITGVLSFCFPVSIVLTILLQNISQIFKNIIFITFIILIIIQVVIV